MILKSINSSREAIYHALEGCRASTLALFKSIDPAIFCRQVHPEFSPVGWHFGHIAYTEALWLLERSAGMPPLFPEYRRLFAADGLPKSDRVYLPTPAEIRHYLDTVRTQVLNYLQTADLDKQERLWRFIIQHESQHSETISFVSRLATWQIGREGTSPPTPLPSMERRAGESSDCYAPLYLRTEDNLAEMIEIPAGEFDRGNDSIDALDNEQPVHRVYLDTYSIDRYPVTCGQYRAFMEAGGYQTPQWWSEAGWQWLQANPVTQPLYWIDDPAWGSHPVCGVSWYEAEAYARFVGKRLPTEAEWEKAASWDAAVGQRRTYPWGEASPDAHFCNHNRIKGQTTPVHAHPDGQSAYGCQDMLGNVWEWTASWFDGYEEFVRYPYAGYSQAYFDGQHRVLKGGSWATYPWAMRCSFRNWYHPGVRQIFAGFRCGR